MTLRWDGVIGRKKRNHQYADADGGRYTAARRGRFQFFDARFQTRDHKQTIKTNCKTLVDALQACEGLHELRQFYDELMKHDWHYMMSDDQSVYVAGRNNLNAIQIKANKTPSYQTMFKSFEDHIFKGGPEPKKP